MIDRVPEWVMTIRRVANGFCVEYVDRESDNPTLDESVIEDNEDDALKSGEELLWEVANYFGLLGNKYDAERLHIIREPGEKYEN